MVHQNGEGPAHRIGGGEARELEQLGRRLEVLLTAEESLRQDRIIRAELFGDDRCSAEGITVRAAGAGAGGLQEIDLGRLRSQPSAARVPRRHA